MRDAEQVLLVDVGNSNTRFGVLRQGAIAHVFRLATESSRTADEMAALLLPLFERVGLDPAATTGFIVSSVVPPFNAILVTLAQEIFGTKAVFIEPGIRTGIPIRYDNPAEVGADRIVNSVAARELYGAPVVVVDFGTATTFDVVNAAGEFIGGIIAPGVAISAEALFAQAARLYRVDLRRPDQLIGRTTSTAMQSGIYFGYLGLVDGILNRLRQEVPGLQKVVATGGLGELLAGGSLLIDEVNPRLTLIGLQLVWERNRTRIRA
jgi:type III pantothenate kinase